MQSSATTSSSLSLVLIYSFVPIVHSRCTESLSIRNDMTTSPPDPQPTWLKNYLHPPCPQSVHSNSKLQSTTQGRDNSSSLAGQHVAWVPFVLRTSHHSVVVVVSLWPLHLSSCFSSSIRGHADKHEKSFPFKGPFYLLSPSDSQTDVH